MCFVDKSNNSVIVNAFKQLLNRRDREKLSQVGYPVGLNGCIPKEYAFQRLSTIFNFELPSVTFASNKAAQLVSDFPIRPAETCYSVLSLT